MHTRYITFLFFGLLNFAANAQKRDSLGHHFPSYQTAILEKLGQDRMDTSEVCRFYKDWKKVYLDSDNVHHYFIYNDEKGKEKDNLTTSEATGYGMIIEAIMAGKEPNAQQYFNGLYDYAMAHHSARSPLLMRWRVPLSGIDEGDSESDTAIDGDLDLAYALILADQQWGSTDKRPYKALAQATLNAILEQEVDVPAQQLRRGNAFGDKDNWTRHTIRMSDFMPAHFKIFDQFMGGHVWGDIITHYHQVYKTVQDSLSPNYHLFPEYLVVRGSNIQFVPKPPLFSRILEHEGIDDGGRDNERGMKDGYNSCREPWRMATDYLLNGDDWSKARLIQLSAGLRVYTGTDACLLTDVFPLTDNLKKHQSQLIDDAKNHSSDLSVIAPLYLASLADERKPNWQDKLRTMLTDDDHWPCPPEIIGKPSAPMYYQNTLRMLSLVLLSGTYWVPEFSKK